nr:hypothetical protein [Tanacetum cinerariifolium]
MDTCTALSRRVEHLELDKIAQALEITKLKRRVKKLERRNKVKVLKLRRLQKVRTTQRVKTSDETMMDDVSNQERMIAEMDQDVDVVLEEAKEVAEDAKIDESVDIQGSKTITAASTTITTVEAQVPAVTLTAAPARVTVAPTRRRKRVDKGKGILIEEPKPLKKQAQIKQDEQYAMELEAVLNKIIDWDESIDYVKKKAKEDPAVKRYQVLKRKPQTEAQARKNIMVHLKNVVGFKMDYFKGMSYDDICPIFEAKFNTNVAFLQKTKEQIEEKESKALKRLNETPAEKAAKRQKLDEEVEELKIHLQIVPNKDDDVYTEATPLARKVPVVDYVIIEQNNKPYYKIIRADDSEVESDEDVPGIDVRVPDEGQVRPNPGDQDEGQARPNPDEQDEGHAGPNPSDVAASQLLPSPVVHAGPNLEHIDLEVTNVSTQPHPEQMDEGFTATAYPKVQENLKLTVEEQVILEEPASSTGTLYSLQHLAKDLSFGDLFFDDKPSEADNEKTTVKTEAESMVSIIIQQDTSAIPPMTTAVSKAVDEIVTDTVDLAIQAPLPNCFRDLPEADMKEILHQRMWETNSYKTHKDHMMLYEALEKFMNRDHTEELLKYLAEARKKKKKIRDSPKTPPGSPPHQPPPPSPPVGPSGTSGSPRAFRSSQVSPPPPPPPSTNQKDWWKPLEEDIPATPEPAWSISSSDMPVPKNNWASTLASTYSPPLKDSLLTQTGDMAMFIDWFCKRQRIIKLKPQDLEGPAFDLVKFFHPNVLHLQYQMEECLKLLTDSVDDSIIRHNVSKPLPLGGPPGQVTSQSDFFFNKDLEYLRYSSKGSRPTLSIFKIKAAYYPDVGLEKIVPDQMWIDKECKYDIAAIAVRTHMRILSVVRIEVFSMYGSPEPSTTQRQEDSHYGSQLMDQTLGYQTTYRRLSVGDQKLPNSAKPHQTSMGCHMLMRFNEIHKFSDGTLHQIDEALDYRFKEFKVAVCSSLRSLKPKRTIESRAKRSSKRISLGHYFIMLASSHTVKSKTDIKSLTHYPRSIARTSE